MMLPTYTSLIIWADSLFIDFPDDNIPLLVNENEWKTWGNQLILQDSFMENSAPPPDTYPDWKAWAQDICEAMANNE